MSPVAVHGDGWKPTLRVDQGSARIPHGVLRNAPEMCNARRREYAFGHGLRKARDCLDLILLASSKAAC